MSRHIKRSMGRTRLGMCRNIQLVPTLHKFANMGKAINLNPCNASAYLLIFLVVAKKTTTDINEKTGNSQGILGGSKGNNCW